MKYENYALYMRAIVYHMNHLQKRKELENPGNANTGVAFISEAVPEESATNISVVTEGNSINLFHNINYNS